MRIHFTPRDDILDPKAVFGRGKAARALALRLLALEDDRLAALRGAAGKGFLIVVGETEDLPWTSGVAYLGRDPDAPRLFLPTMLRPEVALDLFERAVAKCMHAFPPPWAVLHAPPTIVSLAAAGPIDRAEIQKWLSLSQ